MWSNFMCTQVVFSYGFNYLSDWLSHNYIYRILVEAELEPIVLKNLPIIPSRTSSIVLTNHRLLFLYCSFNFTGSVKLMSKMHTKLLGN